MTMALALSPNDVAEQLTGRPYLSYSAISAFRTCSLRWSFRYVLGLPEESISPSLVFGRAIHAGLERHFTGLLNDGTPPALGELLDAFVEEWELATAGRSLGDADDDDVSQRQLAEKMLRAFQVSPAATPKGRIVAIEEELTATITPESPDLLGRLDLVVETDDAIVVTDFKSSRSRWSADQTDTAGDQLLLYADLVASFAQSKAVQLQFVVLTKTKEPSVNVHAVVPDPHRLAWTRRTVERVWAAMRSGHVFPNPSPMNCNGCPFRQACREWTG